MPALENPVPSSIALHLTLNVVFITNLLLFYTVFSAVPFFKSIFYNCILLVFRNTIDLYIDFLIPINMVKFSTNFNNISLGSFGFSM